MASPDCGQWAHGGQLSPGGSRRRGVAVGWGVVGWAAVGWGVVGASLSLPNLVY